MNRFLFLVISAFITINLQCQNIIPNFKLAKENTFSKLVNRYNSRKVIPHWINNYIFIYVIKETGNELTLYEIDCKNQNKSKIQTTFDKTGDYQYDFTYDNREFQLVGYTYYITEINIPKNKMVVKPEFSTEVVSHNLILVSKESGKSIQLSNDGEIYYSYRANIDYNYTNEQQFNDSLPGPANTSWSPDSSYFIASRTDAREIKNNWVINSLTKPRPSLTTYKQRNPGDKFPNDEIWIYNMENDNFSQLNLRKWENENYWFVDWSRFKDGFFIQRINREQNKCDILLVDKLGNYKVVIGERPDANIYFPMEFIELGNDSYLWQSRRDGWSHLYIINSQNETVKQLTTGDYTVERVIGIDSTTSRLIFTAFGKEKNINPYYRFLYSLNYNTNEVKLLTTENANHEISFSPDFDYFTDVFSRVDLPHKSILRSSNGDLLLNIEEANTSDLTASEWENPEIFTVKAADSVTILWGVMWKPNDFDPDKSYPIITFVYPGPQDNFIPLNYFERLNNVHLSQYGFIVVMCDTRGSSYKRSKEFSEYYRTNLRDYPLADNKYMIEQLTDRHSFINPSKIGVWGGSSGGFMAASAILQYPDFYKVCVSRAGQHEPRIFHSWWSDIFNTPIDYNAADTLCSNISLAGNLKGSLFIIHGETDMNVHPSNSALLANELMKSGKYFDYLVVPGGGHGWSHNGLYVQKRIWLYFIENLMDYKIENVDIMDY
jgi:dipeptidyl-peptidase 4